MLRRAGWLEPVTYAAMSGERNDLTRMENRERHAMKDVHWVIGAAIALGIGTGSCSAGPATQAGAANGGGAAVSQTAAPVAGVALLAGASGTALAYASPPASGASPAGPAALGGAGAGAGNAGTAAPVQQAARFDAGSDPNRNNVGPTELCTRLAAINCAGEAYCCNSATRTVEMCQVELTSTCQNDLMLDQIAMNPITGFDRAAAALAYAELERKASLCDSSVTAWGGSYEGLRGILKGTLAPNSDCSPPPAASDAATLAASLVGCAEPQSYACGFTSLVGAWTCAPKVGVGGTCNTDNNCTAETFCTIAVLTTTGLCTERKPIGATCTGPTECVSLFCKKAKCVAADQQAAYCLQD
jgi:hypothetical protein